MKIRTTLIVFFAMTLSVLAHAQEQKRLYLLTWSNFVDRELFNKFTEETGIKVVADSFDSNEAMMAKLQSGSSYDVASVSNYYVQPVIAADLARRVDLSKTLPNWKNVSAFVQYPDYDPDHYTIPNSFGTMGIIVNRKLYKGPVKTWNDLYKPMAGLKGKIGMIDDPNSVFTTAYSALSKPLCDDSPKTYKAVEGLLLGQKSSVVSYSFGGAVERVAAGDVSVQLGWYTFVFQNRKTNKELEYILPAGPIYGWIETFFIPKSVTNADAAEKFMNFMLRPENSGHFNNFIGYIPPVEGAASFLSDDLKKSPELVSTKSKRLVFQRACSIDVINAQSKIWEKLTK